MGESTNIEWAHHTFNPWYGCQKVGPGCDNCYAEGWAKRSGLVKWGPDAERRRSTPANWRQPLKWNAEAQAFGIRYRVFCASLADVFDNQVPPAWRSDLFALIAATPNLDWLLLTKRIGNARSMIAEASAAVEFHDANIAPWTTAKPWANVWLGITVVNQEEADRDIPKLLRVPAVVRWLSMEPLLGPVDLSYFFDLYQHEDGDVWRCSNLTRPLLSPDWIVVGGESGPKARPMHPGWAYSLRDQCEAACVPFLFKQWGEWVSPGHRAFGAVQGEFQHIKSDGSLWGDDLTGDENADVITVVRVGKKAAGRLLGCQQHDGFPDLAVSHSVECKRA